MNGVYLLGLIAFAIYKLCEDAYVRATEFSDERGSLFQAMYSSHETIGDRTIINIDVGKMSRLDCIRYLRWLNK
jgi:hypothetical protein